MAIGGFNNNGGELSLAQFIRYVRAGDIHYFIASGGGGGQGRIGRHEPDLRLGPVALQRPDDRRRDGVRPHPMTEAGQRPAQ